MELKEETLSSEVLYRGRVVTLKKDRVRLENGVEAAREVVCHPGGVSAAALTPDNRIYLCLLYTSAATPTRRSDRRYAGRSARVTSRQIRR